MLVVVALVLHLRWVSKTVNNSPKNDECPVTAIKKCYFKNYEAWIQNHVSFGGLAIWWTSPPLPYIIGLKCFVSTWLRTAERCNCLLMAWAWLIVAPLVVTLTSAQFTPGCSFSNGQCLYNVQLGHLGQCDQQIASGSTAGNQCCENLQSQVNGLASDVSVLKAQVKFFAVVCLFFCWWRRNI